MKNELRVCLVGAGHIGEKHLLALGGLEGVKISAIVDSDAARAERAALAHGGRAFRDLEEALECADAVWICTPPSSHRRFALAAIQAGKPVMCEKPLATTLEDAEAVAAAARVRSVQVGVGFNMRFRRGFRRLKELIDAGTAGKIVGYYCQRFGSIYTDAYNWRTDPAQICGMSVESLAHDIDLIRWMLGEIVEVRAALRESRPDLPGFDDNAAVLLELDNGCLAGIQASWSSKLGRGSRGVVGTDGAIFAEGPNVWDITSLRWSNRTLDHEAAELFVDTLDLCSYRAQAADFVAAVNMGRRPAADVEDGLAALRVSLAILESSRRGGGVKMEK